MKPIIEPGVVEDPTITALLRICASEKTPQEFASFAETRLRINEQAKVQTVILSKERFETAEAAKAWAKEHGFKVGKIDETDSSFRFRQIDAGQFTRLRTKKIDTGVSIVTGPIRESRVAEGVPPELATQLIAMLKTDIVLDPIFIAVTDVAVMEDGNKLVTFWVRVPQESAELVQKIGAEIRNRLQQGWDARIIADPDFKPPYFVPVFDLRAAYLDVKPEEFQESEDRKN